MNRCENLGQRREKNDQSSAGKKLWKSRAQNALGNRFAIPTFPQLRRRAFLSLDDRDHFLQNPPASVASLRRLITSSRNADHDQPGIPITFGGIPSTAGNSPKFGTVCPREATISTFRDTVDQLKEINQSIVLNQRKAGRNILDYLGDSEKPLREEKLRKLYEAVGIARSTAYE